MRTHYAVTITGTTPLIMHADNIEWADEMSAWKDRKENKSKSKAGDDRSPAFRWIGSLYHDGEHICLPSENFMRCLMEAGAQVPVPGGRSGKTFKSQTQSGIMPGALSWPLLVASKPVAVAPVLGLQREPDFAAHKAAAVKMGFELMCKRAKIGASKHIRVRPLFREWSAVVELTVTDPQITPAALEDIIDVAGTFKGLGDWRPGGKTPGRYGMFTAVLS